VDTVADTAQKPQALAGKDGAAGAADSGRHMDRLAAGSSVLGLPGASECPRRRDLWGRQRRAVLLTVLAVALPAGWGVRYFHASERTFYVKLKREGRHRVWVRISEHKQRHFKPNETTAWGLLVNQPGHRAKLAALLAWLEGSGNELLG
jgi:hypothetical protein